MTGGNMIFRVAVASIAVFAAAPLSAQMQVEKAISVDEWRQALSDVSTDDDDSILNLATRYTNESTDLINSGNRAEALHKSTMALVLTQHIFARKEREGHPAGRRDVDASGRLQTTLIGAGVPLGVMKLSAANLGLVLGQPAASMAVKVRATPRPATAAERTAMISVIKRGLIDPTSPLFGRADIVGNQACFTVNAKNRFGGYTGNQEAVLYFNAKTKTWTGGGTINYPHGVCLDTVD